TRFSRDWSSDVCSSDLRGKRGEQLWNLERACDAHAGDIARLAPRDVGALERDGALVRLEVAGEHVHERGLARPVRSDQARNRLCRDIDGDIAGRHNGTELLVQTDCRNECARGHRPASCACWRARRFSSARWVRLMSPPGRNTISASMLAPMTTCHVLGAYW